MRRIRTRRDERGDTLVEVLLALTVFSIASVAALVGFMTMISSSTQYQDTASFTTAIQNASQAVSAQIEDVGSSLYVPCATVADYQPGGADAVSFANADLPLGYTAEVTQVQYWNGSSFVNSCQSGTAQPQPEEITVTLTDTLTGKSEITSLIVGPADSEYTVPATPSELSASGPNGETIFTESWAAANTNGDPVTGYVIRYSTDDQTWTTDNTASSATSYTLSVPMETAYYVEVAAVNAIGQGAWSAPDVVQWVTTGSTETPTYGYACPNGQVLSGTNCLSSSSVGAQPNYQCQSGTTDVLSGATCTPHATYPAVATSNCPTGATPSGPGCIAAASSVVSSPIVAETGLACSSVGNCVALIGATGTYVDTEVNGVWSGSEQVAPTLEPYGMPYDGELNAVTCTSTDCTVVGYYVNNAYTAEPMADSEVGGVWGAGVALPLFGGSYYGGSFYTVACASQGNCVAGGFFYDVSTDNANYAFVNTETNGTWSTTTSQIASNLPTSGSGYLYEYVIGSACSSAGNCSVTGSFVDNASNAAPFVDSETNGTWAAAVEVEAVPGDQPGNATAISCPSNGNCTAIGDVLGGSYNDPYAITETAGAWGTPVILAANLNVATGVASTLTCTSIGNCVVGGYYTTSNIVNGVVALQPFVQVETAGVWGSATALAIAGSTFGQVQELSCVSPGNCTAGGDYEVSGFINNAYIAVESNGSWATPVEVANSITYAGTFTGGPAVTGLACYVSGCQALGTYILSQSENGTTHQITTHTGVWIDTVVPATVTYTCAAGDALSGQTCSTATYAATSSYTCASGTLSGSTCTTTTTYAATPDTTYSYSCPSGGSLSGTSCVSSSTSTYDASLEFIGDTPYTCNSGWTLVGATCERTASISQAACNADGGSYSGGSCTLYTAAGGGQPEYQEGCPDGGSLNSETDVCTLTTESSYAATATPIGTTYSCNGSDTLSGTTCTTTSTAAAELNYSCSRGGSISGTNCVGSTGYAAAATYSCSAGTLNGEMCTTSSTEPASQVVTGETTTYTYGFTG